MSIWYYYVNLDKKEYFSSLDIGYSLKIWPYYSTLLPLIGFLQIQSYQTNSIGHCDGNHTPEDKDDFVLFGHWAGDNCILVQEQTEVYDAIEECEDQKGGIWTNISHQLLEEYNKHIDELSEFWLTEEDKMRLHIPVGAFGVHNK